MAQDGVGDGLVQIVVAIGGYFIQGAEERRAREAAERLAREARAREQAAQLQQEKWLEMVRRQMSQGDAGDAEEHEAIAGLSGRGGRKSALDEEWF